MIMAIQNSYDRFKGGKSHDNFDSFSRTIRLPFDVDGHCGDATYKGWLLLLCICVLLYGDIISGNEVKNVFDF